MTLEALARGIFAHLEINLVPLAEAKTEKAKK
jgi:hypothetical protein